MNFINKINKYLLENYPLIWNTRLVWMLIANAFIHLLFFIIGYSSANTIENLKEQYKLSMFFYDFSAVYYNFLISIFILLIWIIFYLRNNAFKNLYHLSKGTLYKQFCIILFIFFISISQYYSFMQGLRTKVKSLYDWEEVDRDIKTFNKTALFLIQYQRDYEIDKKQYPAPFPLKVAITNRGLNIYNVDTTQAYIKYKESFFQFYKSDEKTNEVNYFNKYDFEEQNFIKEIKNRNVIDISKYKRFLQPSLFNYSKELFSIGQDSLTYENQLKHHQKILEKGDDSEIKNELKTFISLANTYKIEHNLEVDSWFKLINDKPNYFLSKLIRTSNPLTDELYSNREYNNETNYNSRYKTSIPYSKNLYVTFGGTDNLFKNVYNSYYPKLDVTFLYFITVFAFILSILLFLFKTTGIKTLLLSFVGSLVVFIIVIWLMSSFRNILDNSDSRMYFVILFISFLIILLSFLSYVLKWKKIIISIFWSLGLFALPSFFLFSMLYYIEYLKQIYLSTNINRYNYRSDFEIWFKSNGFWAVILIWLLTVFVYAVYIRKLKARPE